MNDLTCICRVLNARIVALDTQSKAALNSGGKLDYAAMQEATRLQTTLDVLGEYADVAEVKPARTAARVLPRPCSRVRREVLHVTPAGLETTRKSAEQAVSRALDAYSDAGAQIQEGGSISAATWDALGERLNRSTRRVAICAALLD